MQLLFALAALLAMNAVVGHPQAGTPNFIFMMVSTIAINFYSTISIRVTQFLSSSVSLNGSLLATVADSLEPSNLILASLV